ncbi:MAG: sulfatase [Rikenellaceae bacterium]
MKSLNYLILATAGGAVIATSGCSTAPKEKTPINILWLFGEDISPWMPAYGDNTVKTPNLDFLIDNGVLFTNCYASCSVSSPTRSSLVTGMMQTTIGAHNHRTARTDKLIYNLPEGIKVLPELLKEKGYHTFCTGKDDFNWHYNWHDYWTGTYEWAGFYDKCGVGSWNDRKEGQPFFGEIELYGGKNHGKVDNPVNPDDVEVPPYYPDCENIRNQRATHYNQIQLTDIEIGAAIEEMKKDGVYENTIIVFLSDNGYQMMRDKQFLYDSGIKMPLVISCPGNPQLLKDLGIEIGSTRDDLVSLMDLNATTLSLAGVDIPDYMEAKDVFADDFHRDYIVAARDRCDYTIDRIRAIRTKEFKYIRNFMTDRPLLQPQYRDKQAWYKDLIKIHEEGKIKFSDDWMSDVRPAEELYDIVNDPHEINNLAKDPAYTASLAQMRGYLESWIEETDDKGQYPETQKALEIVYQRWGDRCVNPEYDEVKKYMKVDTTDVDRYQMEVKAKKAKEAAKK